VKSRVEKALAAALAALKADTYGEEAYTGTHSHVLERDKKRTRNDGAHRHRYRVMWEEKEVTLLTEEGGGVHAHALGSSAADMTEKDGAHSHRLKLPDGDEVTTDDDGAHVHRTEISRTAVDGAHQHDVELPDGVVVKSLADEPAPDAPKPEVDKAEPSKGPLPTLKMPDPAFNVERMRAEKSTAVLSRIARSSREDQAQILLNEVEPTKAEGQEAWGIVVLRKPQEYKNFEAIPAETRAGVDRFSVAEFQNIAPIFVMEMEPVKLFAKPIPLKSLVPGRRFGPDLDLEEARADKAMGPTDKDDLSTADLPPMTGPIGVTPKIPFKKVTPSKLKKLSIEELLDLDNDAHLVYDTAFSESTTNSIDGLSREDLVNAHIFIVREMIRRGDEHPRIIAPTGNSSRDALDMATLHADPELREAYKNAEIKDEVIGEATDEEKAYHIEERRRHRAGKPAAAKAGTTEDLAAINSGAEGKYDEIGLEEVLDHFAKGFLLRAPVVRVVGSLVNHGKTKNDIDLLIDGPLDPKTLHVIKFRLGRMLPPELSKRVQFHTDDDPDVGGAGPFSAYVDLFDLKIEPAREKKIIDMSKALEACMKDQPAFMKYPDKEDRRSAILQAHFRGKSVHLDFRLKTGDDFLTGWTLAAQKAGAVPDVDTVGEGKQIASSFSTEGSDWNKAFIAPDRVRAFPKQVQPVVWLTVGGKRFEPGEIGATAEEAGVFAEIAKPKVTPLILTPFFAEYAVEDDPKFGGLLTFRLLTGQAGAPQAEIDAGRQTREGEAFWTAMLTDDLTPAVLRTRAVHTGLMPPLGRSGLPIGIRASIPKEFQYWRQKTEKAAQEVRDALVKERLVTKDTVQFINNRFRLVAKQKKAWTGADLEPESTDVPVDGTTWGEIGAKVEAAAAVDTATALLKKLSTAEYSVVWQRWKGPVVIRSSPTKEIFHFFVKRGEREVEDFMLLADPLEEDKVGAVQRTLSDVDADKILALEGDVPPGEKIAGFLFNESKDTPSSASVLSKGQVEFLEDSRSFKKFRIKGGDLADASKDGFVLVAEEAGGVLWQWERGQVPSRNVPEQKIQKVHDTRDVRIHDKVYTDVQIWDPKKMGHTDDKTNDRQELRSLALFQPMKTAPRATNEFHGGDEDRIFKDFATDEALKLGILVQPKYNGWRVMAEKDANGQLLLLAEDIFRRPGSLRNNYDQNPGLRAAADRLPGPYVLDAEFMAVDADGNFLPRRDLAAFRGAQNQDDAGVRLVVHRALYLPGPKNMVAAHEVDMLDVLVPWLKKAGEKHFVPVQTVGTAKSREQLLSLIKEAGRIPGSEGAMLKIATATYSLGGHTDSWAKIKLLRSVFGIVTDRHAVAGSEGVYNFFYAFGPIAAKDKDLWGETVELDGKTYIPGGRTFNRKLDAKVGDVIEVEVTELLFDKSKPGKWKITGFTPAAVDVVNRAPMTPDDVIEILSASEIKKALVVEEKEDEPTCRLCAGLHSSSEHEIPQSQQMPQSVDKALLTPWTQEVRLMKAASKGEERFVLGVVLEPETIDAQRDIYSADEVRKAAHGFMEHFAHIGLMHKDLIDGRVKILESYLAPSEFTVDGQLVKKGTWLLGARIVDEELWTAIKEGRLTGWSIGGSAIKEPDSAYQHLVAVLTN
jgi:hypothetical protein